MRKFKHDVNEVIEGCAEVLSEKMDFNPLQVLRYFQLFWINFFENAPEVPKNEVEDWYYLRDPLTHAAVVYNHESKEVRLVEPEKYWDEKTKEEFRLSEEIIQEDLNKKLKVINETRRSDYYRKIKHLLKWFYECPLPWLATHFLGYSSREYISSLLKYSPWWFNLKEDEEFEDLAKKISDAYYYEKLPKEGKVDYVRSTIDIHAKGGKVIIDPLTEFRTATDVLEFLVKHSGKRITVTCKEDEDAYYKYNIDVYY